MSDVLRFIRKNGKIIPIRALAGHALKGHNAVKIVTAPHKIAKGIKAHNSEPGKVKINRALDMTGLGLSVASGVISAATFAGGLKSMLGGAAVSHAIDAVGIAANVASVAGKGNLKERSKQAAKQEARNFAIGNSIYYAGLVGLKKNREEFAGYAKKILSFGRKALGVASEVE